MAMVLHTFITQLGNVTPEKEVARPKDTEPRCKNCVFFLAKPRVHSDSNIYGECRRSPPTDVGFPGVEKTDWCGAWHAYIKEV
jgi:hypothetical protein